MAAKIVFRLPFFGEEEYPSAKQGGYVGWALTAHAFRQNLRNRACQFCPTDTQSMPVRFQAALGLKRLGSKRPETFAKPQL